MNDCLESMNHIGGVILTLFSVIYNQGEIIKISGQPKDPAR